MMLYYLCVSDPANNYITFFLETQLNPYELVRLRQCMQNASRFKELGITALVNAIGSKRVVSQKDDTADHRKDRSGDPDYNPLADETSDAELCDTNNSKVPIQLFHLSFMCFVSFL